MSAKFEHSAAEEAFEIDADAASAAPITAQVMIPVGASSAETSDRAFVAALRRASLLRDLTEGELSRLLSKTTAQTDFARHLDLLELYYSSGDDVTRMRRLEADRFVVHRASSGDNAHAVVRRLATVAPELGRPTLERIGSDDGPLVLRSGERISAVTDEEDFVSSDDLDDGNVTVRALVQAANGLLKQVGFARRWVLFRCDGSREAFCVIEADPAMDLCVQGLLEERSAARLLEFCSF